MLVPLLPAMIFQGIRAVRNWLMPFPLLAANWIVRLPARLDPVYRRIRAVRNWLLARILQLLGMQAVMDWVITPIHDAIAGSIARIVNYTAKLTQAYIILASHDLERMIEINAPPAQVAAVGTQTESFDETVGTQTDSFDQTVGTQTEHMVFATTRGTQAEPLASTTVGSQTKWG